MRWLVWILLVLTGCTRTAVPVGMLRDRILAPEVPEASVAADSGRLRDPARPDEETLPEPRKVEGAAPEALTDVTPDCPAPDTFSLLDAVGFALDNNPRLRIALENIDQQRGQQQAAFAPFLPTLNGSFRIVGASEPLSGYSNENLPTVFGFGPGAQTFELSELHLAWTVWDFGRTMGRYEQAISRVDIARLQAQRAKQTIVYDTATAYYRVLLARATLRIATQAVRDATSILELTRNLFDSGVVTKDSVLRAEVRLAETRQLRVVAVDAVFVSMAALNLAMGRNVSLPVQVVDITEEPPFALTLAQALQIAVDNRREFDVARRSIELAQQGVRVKRSDFKPRILIRGTIANVEGQGIETGNVAIGGIHFDWDLYQGGRRLGELRSARAEARSALAQAELISDNIAFEVNQAYRAIEDARERITLSRTAVAQAEENQRLVVNKYKAGDATPTDVVDAETSLTRTQQNYASALYDYQTALVKLEYAMGVTATGAADGRCAE